jgi:hypothetical protein
MKRLSLALLFGAACVASASTAPAQDLGPGRFTVIPATRMAPPDSAAEQFSAVTSPTPLPTFSYTLTASAALGGGVFSGSIVGRSPLNRGKTTTTIPTQLVPLVITINGVVYDPTQPDACVTGNPTDISIIANSPIFTNNPWTMNGVNIGTTQYIDAFQRAQFWSQVQGTPYHLILQESQLASQALSFPGGTNNPETCANGHASSVGVVDFTTFDNAIQALIIGPLAGTVNVGTFPIFLTKDVVLSDNGGCCILGYHSGLFVGGQLQIYSPFSIDTIPVFGGGFVDTLSHEMGEAINDPPGNNPTPHWGNIGQVVGACQSNFEVGDPLSPGFGTPTNPFVVVGGNALTYNLQELAFYSWFYGSTALGTPAGGGFSNHGTFLGDAIICPPGGTN